MVKNSEKFFAIEIQFKNNWIRNEILNNDREVWRNAAATCWSFPHFPSLSFVFREFFFDKTLISSMNDKVIAKQFTPMHKLSRKSEQLIPPAQHPMCSALLNKFIFFFSLRSLSSKRRKKKKLCEEMNKERKYCVWKMKTCCVLKRSRRAEIFCERSIIVYWEFYSSSFDNAIVLLLRNFFFFMAFVFYNWTLFLVLKIHFHVKS